MLVLLLLHDFWPDLKLRRVLIHYLLVFLDISIIIMHLLAILFFNVFVLILLRVHLPGAFPEGLVQI